MTEIQLCLSRKMYECVYVAMM